MIDSAPISSDVKSEETVVSEDQRVVAVRRYNQANVLLLRGLRSGTLAYDVVQEAVYQSYNVDRVLKISKSLWTSKSDESGQCIGRFCPSIQGENSAKARLRMHFRHSQLLRFILAQAEVISQFIIPFNFYFLFLVNDHLFSVYRKRPYISALDFTPRSRRSTSAPFITV